MTDVNSNVRRHFLWEEHNVRQKNFVSQNSVRLELIWISFCHMLLSFRTTNLYSRCLYSSHSWQIDFHTRHFHKNKNFHFHTRRDWKFRGCKIWQYGKFMHLPSKNQYQQKVKFVRRFPPEKKGQYTRCLGLQYELATKESELANKCVNVANKNTVIKVSI